MGISICAYAKHRRISHTAVRKAIKQGRITTEPDGTIDPERADKEWQANTLSPKTNATKQQTDDKSVLIPVSAINKTRAILEDHNITPVSKDKLTYAEAKTANEIIKTQTNYINLRKLEGELVDCKKATDHVFQLARQERDAWLTWPSRVANQMAAENNDLHDPYRLQLILERYVREHLLELSEIKPSFT